LFDHRRQRVIECDEGIAVLLGVLSAGSDRQCQNAGDNRPGLCRPLIAQIVVEEVVHEESFLGGRLTDVGIHAQAFERHQVVEVSDLALHGGELRNLDRADGDVSDLGCRGGAPVVGNLGQGQATGRHARGDRISDLRNPFDAFDLTIGRQRQHINARQFPLVVEVHGRALHHPTDLEAGVGQIGRREAGDVLVSDLIAGPRGWFGTARTPVDFVADHLVVSALGVGRAALLDGQDRDHGGLGQYITAASEGAVRHRFGLLLGDLDVEHLGQRRAVDRHHHAAIAAIVEDLRFR